MGLEAAIELFKAVLALGIPCSVAASPSGDTVACSVHLPPTRSVRGSELLALHEIASHHGAELIVGADDVRFIPQAPKPDRLV